MPRTKKQTAVGDGASTTLEAPPIEAPQPSAKERRAANKAARAERAAAAAAERTRLADAQREDGKHMLLGLMQTIGSAAGALNLNERELAMLLALEHCKIEPSVRTMAAVFGLNRQAASRTASILERHNLVRREHGVLPDKRDMRVVLTDQGHDTVAAVLSSFRGESPALKQRIEQEEQRYNRTTNGTIGATLEAVT